MPPFPPTEKQRGMVEALAGLGMPQEEISLLIINPKTGKPVDAKTLRKAFDYELRAGSAKVKAEIARTLFQMATEDKSVSAALFLAKARGGYRTLLLICGASGAAGAVMWKLLELLGYVR
ncbi:MAG TPA: hypothetical protein VEK12_00610 [Alphaproteobacteria bacterium]|nr:hypothetical protein [Alphaproteobacteria bacterium]